MHLHLLEPGHNSNQITNSTQVLQQRDTSSSQTLTETNRNFFLLMFWANSLFERDSRNQLTNCCCQVLTIDRSMHLIVNCHQRSTTRNNWWTCHKRLDTKRTNVLIVNCLVKRKLEDTSSLVVLSGGAPTPAGTSVFIIGIWELGICSLMGGAFIT